METSRRLRSLAAPHRSRFAAAGVLGLLTGLATIGMAVLLAWSVDAVFLGDATLSDVTPWLTALALLILLRAFLAWSADAVAHDATTRIQQDLRMRLVRHVGRSPPGGDTGRLTTTLLEAVEAIGPYFSRYLPAMARAAAVPLAVLLVVLPFDPATAGILLVTAPLVPLFMVLIGKWAGAVTQQRWNLLGRLGGRFLDLLQGLPTLQSLGAVRAQTAALDRSADDYRKATLGVLRIAFLSALVLELIVTLSTAIVAVAIGLRLLDGGLSFRTAFLVLLLVPEFYLPLRTLGTHRHPAMEGVEAAERIHAVLDIVIPPVPADPVPAPTGPFDLDLRGVTVTHSDGRTPLRDLSVHIPSGQRVAVVGRSGAGKTTLLHVMAGLVPPTKGTIAAGGVPLDAMGPGVWHCQVALLGQRPHVFHGTVADDLRLAVPQATDADVEAAARAAHAHDFITALPGGYQASVGDRGTRLSRGQAQRIALGRALLKDAAVLLLDEPTAHLDPESERAVEEALGHAMEGRTSVLVAHRLALAHRADRVLVMEDGAIVEDGAPGELLDRHGPFRALWDAYGGAP